MKFGVLQFFSWPDRRISLPTVYERVLQRVEIMDRSDYDAIWVTEHHFNDYSVCPSIPVMGAFIAARTTRMHIATGVTLAAFYHPLRLAEEIALLDILSGGRVGAPVAGSIQRNSRPSASNRMRAIRVFASPWIS